MKRPLRFASVAALAALALAWSACNLQAGVLPLYSWESGLEGWSAANATLANSTTLGVTDGGQSLLIDNLTSGFKNDAGFANASGAAYTNWGVAASRIAAGDTDVKLEFDFSFDNADATNIPAFGQLGLFVNSTGVGFKQYGTGAFLQGNVGSSFPTLGAASITDGVTLTSLSATSFHVAIPLGPTKTLNIGAPVGGHFYQVGFKTNGGWGGSVDWAIDNMVVTGAAIPEPSCMLLGGLGAAASLILARRRR
jgi:hypothetical protein